MKRRRSRHSAAEYFIAALGLLILVMVAALVACPAGCRVGLSPELGIRSSQPTPAPPAAP